MPTADRRRRSVLLAPPLAWMAAHLPARASASLPPDAPALHVLNRVAYGPRPGDLAQLQQRGVDRYIDEQLQPERIALPDDLARRLDALGSTQLSQRTLIAQFREAQQAARDGTESGKALRKEAYQRLVFEAGEARLWRAIESPRQLQETLTEFWFNHFNVFSGKGLDRALVQNYEREAIRPHVLGRFRDLLGATARHPAMLFYLDNWLSTADGFRPRNADMPGAPTRAGGLNENYARELMELHTLGVEGGYAQQDVTELARIFTGWTFSARPGTGDSAFVFDPRRHDGGVKAWLGRTVAPAGQAEGEAALDVLAAHPSTARRVSYALAQYFVADEPPAPLVERLSRRFLDSGGDLREVTATLLRSPEFRNPLVIGAKFKTPYRYMLSAVRAAGSPVPNVRPLLAALVPLGMPLYGCQTPDGYKFTEAAWLNPDALSRRIAFATAFATGRLPLGIPQAADALGAGTSALDARALMAALGPGISPKTEAVVAQAAPALQAALVLGSPDFMRH